MLDHLTVLKTLVVGTFFSMPFLPAMAKEAEAEDARAVGQWQQRPCFHMDLWQAGHCCCSFLEAVALPTWLPLPLLSPSNPNLVLLNLQWSYFQ